MSNSLINFNNEDEPIYKKPSISDIKKQSTKGNYINMIKMIPKNLRLGAIIVIYIVLSGVIINIYLIMKLISNLFVL